MQTSETKQPSESGRPSPLTLTCICNSTETSYMKNILLFSVSWLEQSLDNQQDGKNGGAHLSCPNQELYTV